MRQSSLVLLCWVVLTLARSAWATLAEPLTRAAIVDWVKSANGPASVEAFLQELPDSYRTHYTLMYASRSQQGATPQAPRVILYGKEAKLILTFTGEGNRHSDEVELMQYNDESRRFELQDLKFPARGEGKVVVSAINPPVCLACHRDDPRPNWDHYSFWQGAYAGDDDRDHLSDAVSKFGQEKDLENALLAFLQSASEKPRYEVLRDLAKGYELAGFRRRYEHNIDLNQKLSVWNFRRIARLMSETPDYDRFKYLALEYLSCTDMFSGWRRDLDALLPELAPKIEQEMARRDQRSTATSKSDRVIAFFSARGIPVEDWYMDFVSETGALVTPLASDPALAYALVERDPELRSLWRLTTRTDGYDHEANATIPSAYVADPLELTCALLREKVRDRLSGWKAPNAPGAVH